MTAGRYSIPAGKYRFTPGQFVGLYFFIRFYIRFYLPAHVQKKTLVLFELLSSGDYFGCINKRHAFKQAIGESAMYFDIFLLLLSLALLVVCISSFLSYISG